MSAATLQFSRRWVPASEDRLPRRDSIGSAARICPAPILEALTLFAGIMLYIWVVRAYAAWSVLILFAFVVASHLRRGESARTIGLTTENLGRSVRVLTPYLAAVLGAILVAGTMLHSFRPISLRYGVLRFGLYLGWGLFQQYLLNGYFARRIEAGLPRSHPLTVAAVTSAIFTSAHLPNVTLMLFTFVAGVASVLIYFRIRNVFFLGLAHGMIGFAMIYALPFSMRVGPSLLH